MRKTLRLTISSNESTILGVYILDVILRILPSFTIFFQCEGMVPMRDLGDDYYDFDEKNYCLTGRRHHKKFSLGDPVTIKVARANLEKKQLDFALIEK